MQVQLPTAFVFICYKGYALWHWGRQHRAEHVQSLPPIRSKQRREPSKAATGL